MPVATERRAPARSSLNKVLMSRYTKAVVFAVCLIPAAQLLYTWNHHPFVVNWIEAFEKQSGDWVLRFLALTLLVTPVRRLPGLAALIRYRRMLGLFTFFYACFHFTVYIWRDKDFDWLDIYGDFTIRKFYIFGLIALLSLTPLAVTSFKWWIRKLGRNWQRLHMLVYVAALSGSIHYYLQGKSYVPRAAQYIGLMVILVLYRALYIVYKRWSTERKRLANSARTH